MAETGEHDLDSVRAELRRLGYLSGRFDRFLLQDALKPRPSAGAVLVAGLRVATLAGSVLALVAALSLAALNGNLAATPFDLLPLFLHLLPPAVGASFVAFLLLAAALLALLRLDRGRRIEAHSLTVAVVAGLAAVLPVAGPIGTLARAHGALAVVLAALATAAVAGLLVKVVHAGLLALAVRWTHSAPERRAVSRPLAAAAVLIVAVLLLLPTLLAASPPPSMPPVSLPSAPGERALSVGVDGVLPAEVDYLLADGALPAASALLADGGRLFSYRRPAEPPAAVWTTFATGLPASRHGVTALDSFRPAGVATPLGRSGPLRLWWAWVAAPLGLAEHQPLLADRRTAFTVWELAAHGGARVVAVNQWATYPAQPLPGRVVAHGAFQLLADGASGAVEPVADAAALTALRRRVAAEAATAPSPLPADARRQLAETATGADLFYRRALTGALEPHTRMAALYLPGPDIAAQDWRWNDLAFTDLVRGELVAADRLIAEVRGVQDPGVIALVLDPGRRGGGEGRVLLWTRRGCGGEGDDAPPGEIA
ncbi:MAG TPA: hypothetical protein VKU40_01110, partial [Thermoanaerobaculia bacterium]|nr:hypothetical protein [Thermoanaerobaculia bacterium]